MFKIIKQKKVTVIPIILTLFFIIGCLNSPETKNVTLHYNSSNLDYSKGTSLLEIFMNNNVSIITEKSNFGVFLTGIEELQIKPNTNEYIHVYKNGKSASVGIGELIPEDDDSFSFVIETY